MDIIKQTNRTILFEEFNPEKMDLITLVEDVKGKNGLDDEKIAEINRHLLVRNFDEFLEKFSPTVYSFYNAENQQVVYSLEKPANFPEEYLSEIRLDQNNDFLNMLFTLISNKSSQGTGHVDFNFDRVLDMISPKKVVENIKQVRKEIHYLYGKYDELEAGDPKKLELGDKLNAKFEDARENYNNVMSMLPLAIEDINTRLFLGQAQSDKSTGGSQKIKAGTLSIGSDGELKVLESAKSQSTALVVAGESANNKLVSFFEDDYDDVTETPSDYAKALVVRTFCPLPSVITEIDVKKEIDNYNNYINFYKDAKDEFIKVSKPLVEKILGVKQFFAQYNTRDKNMQPALIITNNKLESIISSNNKVRLETYLRTVNSKTNYNDTIWFGIVSDIDMEAKAKKKASRSLFEGTKEEKNKGDGNSLDTLASLLDVLKDYKIQLFFSFKASEETSFNDMAVYGVEKYKNKCNDLLNKSYSEFAIVCLPNFTVVPKYKSGVNIGNEIKVEEKEEGKLSYGQKEDKLKIWIDGIYIGASYIAAGIVAAYQCPQYLKGLFKDVSTKYPGVRFDIEAGDNNLKAVTTMAKEISGFTDEVKSAINREGFGFVFSSEKEKVTVYKARNLKRIEDGYEPIYRTLVTTYVERIIKNESLDFKEDKIKEFFKDTQTSRIKNWNDNTNYVNSIVKAKGDLSYEIDGDNCQLTMKFNGISKNLSVTITRSEGTDSGKK